MSKRSLELSITLGFFLAWMVNGKADSAVPAWIRTYNSSLSSSEMASRIAVDSSGAVAIAGERNTGFTWTDVVVIKYSPAGQPLWTNVIVAENFSRVAGLAFDPDGNLVVGGTAWRATLDYFLIKYSSTGVPLWTNYYDHEAQETDFMGSLVVATNGDIFVTGRSSNNATNSACATVKYSSSGVPLWTNRYESLDHKDEIGVSLALDHSGNVIVAGQTGPSFPASTDILLLKYSNAGVPIWTNVHNLQTLWNDTALQVAIGPNDSPVIAASSSPTISLSSTYSIIQYSSNGLALWTNQFLGLDNFTPALIASPNGTLFVSGTVTNHDGFLAAFSAAGTLLWSNRCELAVALVQGSGGQLFAVHRGFQTVAYTSGGVALWTNIFSLPSSDAFPFMLAVDSNSNVFVTGTTDTPGSNYDFATVAYSNAGLPLWTNIHDLGPAHNSDSARSLAVAPDGSVIVTGSSSHRRDDASDYTTIKYSAAGVPLWTNFYGLVDLGPDLPSAVICDSAGDIIVAGQSSISSPSSQIATVKYSSGGTPLWTNVFKPFPSQSYFQALALSGDNSVYVAGYTMGITTAFDFVLLKYSPAGVPQWTNFYSATNFFADNRAMALTVAPNGTAFLAGTSPGPSPPLTKDTVTLAYSSAGTPLWTNRYHTGTLDNWVFAIAIDAAQNVFVSGSSRLTNETTPHIFTIKYSSAGVGLWTNRYARSASSTDSSVALAVDSGGNVFMTGVSSNHLSSYDFVTIKYTSGGTPLWTNLFGETGSDDRPSAIAVNATDEVIITGTLGLNRGGAYADIVTIKYSNAGQLLWTATYNGEANGDDQIVGRALGLSPDGAIYVAGQSDANTSSLQVYDFVTIKYVEVSPIRLTPASAPFRFSFTNTPGAPFSVLSSTNLSEDPQQWQLLGPVPELTPGQFQFIDAQPGQPQRYYRVRSP